MERKKAAKRPTTPRPRKPVDIEVRRARARRRLGSDDPRCLDCGHADPLDLELHHIAGRAYDDATVILCRNCHRRRTDPADNAEAPREPPIMERTGHLLTGLADFLASLIARLRELGLALIEGAKECPWPYGWLGAPGA